jgi:tetratricopeptide (TPR) repeat protein
MRLVSYKILILLLFAFSNQLFSQDLSSFSIDSLKYILKSDVTANEEYKAKVCLELSKNYIYKNLDSAEVYAQKGLEFSIKTRYKKGEAVYYIRKCKISEFSYDMDKAIGYGDKAINLYENLEKDRNYLVILNIQAYLHEKQGNIDKALELYLKGLKESKRCSITTYREYIL